MPRRRNRMEYLVDAESAHERPVNAPMMVEPLEARTLFAGDMVIHWNQVMMDMLRQRSPGIGPTVAARDMAIMDIAVFDAVNGIDGTYRSLMVKGNAPKGASKEAAAAQA